MKIFIKGIMAGICISLGGWLYLNCGYKNPLETNALGAFLFPIGLILICNLGYFLYTGKICYLFTDKTTNFLTKIKNLSLGLIGNVVGCLVLGFVLRKTVVINNELLSQYIDKVANNKIYYNWYKMLILSFFCGMFVYFAVETFKRSDNAVMKNLFIVLFISAFILSGFEHCVANMFYFAVGGAYTWEALFALILCVIGNSIGGLFVPFMSSILEKGQENVK